VRVFRIQGVKPEDLAALLSSWARSGDDLQAHARRLAADGKLPLTPDVFAGPPPGQDAARTALLRLFGHDSNAEHAVVHIACEGISLLAAQAVLDCRLGSFTEKSGRHRGIDELVVPTPAEFEEPAARALFEEQVQRLTAARKTFHRPLLQHVELSAPRLDTESEEAAALRHRTTARTILQHLVPLGALSDVCLTANARSLQGLLSKLASADETEQQQLAAAIKTAAAPALPSLLDWSGPSAYRMDTRRALASWTEELLGTSRPAADETNGAVLVRTPDHVEERLVAAILYRHSDQRYRSVRTRVSGLDQAARQGVVDEYLRRRERHDIPLRDLEHVHYTFEVVLDGGALREVLRHRITSRTVQPVSVRHGYMVEPEVISAGLEDGWRAVLDSVAEAVEQLAERSPVGARALIPLGFRQRVLMTWNLRALHHFVQLRSRRRGNRSVRHIAQDVYRQIERAHPLVARSMRVDLEDEGLPGGR